MYATDVKEKKLGNGFSLLAYEFCERYLSTGPGHAAAFSLRHTNDTTLIMAITPIRVWEEK